MCSNSCGCFGCVSFNLNQRLSFSRWQPKPQNIHPVRSQPVVLYLMPSSYSNIVFCTGYTFSTLPYTDGMSRLFIHIYSKTSFSNQKDMGLLIGLLLLKALHPFCNHFDILNWLSQVIVPVIPTLPVLFSYSFIGDFLFISQHFPLIKKSIFNKGLYFGVLNKEYLPCLSNSSPFNFF